MSEIDTKKIFELKQRINALLKEHPELIPLQKKIDEMLTGAGSQHNRCVLLNEIMITSMNTLMEELKKLL